MDLRLSSAGGGGRGLMVPVVLVAALLGLADAAPAVFGAAEQEGFAAFVAAALAGPGSGTALGAYHAVHAARAVGAPLPQAEPRARLCASLAGGLAGDDGIESVAAVRPAPPHPLCSRPAGSPLLLPAPARVWPR